MDATSTESENNKIKIASGRFYEIKDKAQSRRKENKVELEINMERMGSKIIELHKSPRNSRTMSSWIISRLSTGRTHWNNRENGTGKSTF
jgi:ATP-binding cassette subfamily F protein uup